MNTKRTLFSSFFVFISCLFSFVVCAKNITVSNELLSFLGYFEEYRDTPNEIVFLLDESGSITAEKYPEVKKFTELIARNFAVSADKSRVAVVSFSDNPITHVNFIKDSAGNNMCTLLSKIEALGYVGQGTETDEAMVRAKEILIQARQNSHKIIFLITDGQSNQGHDPRAEATRLKQMGVTIFAVGVADVNAKEIEAVATSKNHIYILGKFDDIFDVNTYLVGQIEELSWDYVEDTSLCDTFCDSRSDCCDDHAKCYCGTSGGKYECNCGPGYSGSGHQHDCHECPKGTYKPDVGNKDCISCPKHATTEKKGSISMSDCICEKGYEWHGNYCKIMECAKLEAPLGSDLIPTTCSNEFGTECKVKCKEGFCPYSCNSIDDDDVLPWNQYPLQSRTCLETGKWSGNDFVCEKMRCPALENPIKGKHNCSGSDFTFGVFCSFQCNPGYELSGPSVRECFSNGSWSGAPARCNVKYCEPLKSNAILKVKPKKCSASKMQYGSFCIHNCVNGYTLVTQHGRSDGVNECLSNGTWSGVGNEITCEDISPPTIQCPKPILTQTDPSKSTALVNFNFATAQDNIHVSSVRIKQPRNMKKPPYSFKIGYTKVVFEATDSVNLASTCSFNVTVLDKEPPSVLFCPADIEKFSETGDPMSITWNEPKFADNSGSYNLSPPNKKSGDIFTWGPKTVIYYNVTDDSGNKASCSFKVTVNPYPCPYFDPPANGIVTCDKWQQGRLCSVFCNDGYEFASKRSIPTVFECSQTGSSVNKMATWKPFILLDAFDDFKMPVPDCSRIQKRNAINASIQVNYSVDVCSEALIHKMKLKFLGNLKDFDDLIPGLICPKNAGSEKCIPDNVKVECVPDKSRIKRSLPPSLIPRNTLSISFSIKLHSGTEENFDDTSQPTNDSLDLLLKEVEAVSSSSVKDVYNLTSLPEPKVNYNVIVICTAGQLRINNSCITCPAGTFKEDISDTCMDCPSSTYQDEEGSLSCKSCPVGYTTYQKRSKLPSDCKAPCQPGSYSRTSFEPCFFCPLHTYQENPRRQECIKCPRGLQTWKVGANSSSDCTTPCNSGSYSDTGFEPCTLCDFGFYQPDSQQKVCSICPNDTSTEKKGSNSLQDCKAINICMEMNPCTNGSTCIPNGNEYTCVCQQGYFGEHCDETNDICDEDFCLNNGTCKKKSNEFSCSCSIGFSGTRCEINIDDCKKETCLNRGECQDLVNDYECICLVGFSGKNCEINIFDCASNPCSNGGTCFDKIKGFKCCCPPGYTGHNCDSEIKENPCDELHCLNGGVCISNYTDLYCSCKSGYTGDNCEINIDDCYDHICYNDGICIDGVGNATCKCKQMFAGTQCEKALLSEYSLSFSYPTTADYAKIPMNKRLQAITISLFIKTTYKDSQARPTPISYSYYDVERNIVVEDALTFYDTKLLIVYLHGKAFHTGVSVNKDSKWHHYALVWERKHGQWSFFVDGEKVIDDRNFGKDKYIWPGVFVLGQEQDSLGGTFSTPEAFVGDITEFNVWDYALSDAEIKSMSSSCGYIGNVISWYQISNHLHGNIIVSGNVDLCRDNGVCSEEKCHCLYSPNKTADYCKHEVQDCSINPCKNDQPCIEDGLGSYCNCSYGYEGKFCEYDINECLDNNGGCSHSCVNSVGFYNCTCPENMMLLEDGLTCKDTTFCEQDGVVLLDGQTTISSCKECTCVKSVFECSDLLCKDVTCQPEENLITFPGECCPRCMHYSFCFVSPNNTVSTFKFSTLQFTNDCTYSLVEDCVYGHFSVQLESLKENTTSEKTLSIFQSCSKLQLTKSGQILLNNEYLLPPFKNDLYDVKSDNSSTEILTHSGLYVQWLTNGEILLSTPHEIAQHTCGVCGKIQEHSVKYEHFGTSPSDKKICIWKITDDQFIPASKASFFNATFLFVILIFSMCYLSCKCFVSV